MAPVASSLIYVVRFLQAFNSLTISCVPTRLTHYFQAWFRRTQVTPVGTQCGLPKVPEPGRPGIRSWLQDFLFVHDLDEVVQPGA